MATEPQKSSRIAHSKTPITRDTFIASDYVRRALTLKTMLTYDDEGELKEVRIPPKVRKAGVLPKGYAVDFCFDPETAAVTLRKNGYETEDQLGQEVIRGIRDIINSRDNLRIVPDDVVREKREKTHEMSYGDSDA